MCCCITAVSIHTSRGFSGYSQPSCGPRLRFLGPSARVAAPLTLLWLTAVLLHLVLLVFCLSSFTASTQKTVSILQIHAIVCEDIGLTICKIDPFLFVHLYRVLFLVVHLYGVLTWAVKLNWQEYKFNGTYENYWVVRSISLWLTAWHRPESNALTLWALRSLLNFDVLSTSFLNKFS